ncbi:ribosome maturation factor RimM [Methylomagnum sp.]
MSRFVTAGEILGAYGVKGWVKVQSHTEPPENILRYSPWILDQENQGKEYRVIDGKRHGNVVIARLEGVADRDQAALLQRQIVSVSRNQFAPLKRGQYYWADLIGLEVRTVDGVVLGDVADMMETGANDVMEVHGDHERLIPFVIGEFVKEVQIDEGFIIVDWDPEF